MSTTPDYGEPWGYDIDYDMALTKNGSVCDANRAVACVNACAGMADPAAEIDAMREALREAHDVFVNLSEYWNKDQNENAMADACWHTVETSYDALAKLEPFIKP